MLKKYFLYVTSVLLFGVLLSWGSLHFVAIPMVEDARAGETQAQAELAELEDSYARLEASYTQAVGDVVDLTADVEHLEKGFDGAKLVIEQLEAVDRDFTTLEEKLAAAEDDVEALEEALSQYVHKGKDVEKTKNRLYIALAMYKFMYAKELSTQAHFVGAIYPTKASQLVRVPAVIAAEHIQDGVYILNKIPNSEMPGSVREFKQAMQTAHEEITLAVHGDNPQEVWQALQRLNIVINEIEKPVIEEMQDWNLFPVSNQPGSGA